MKEYIGRIYELLKRIGIILLFFSLSRLFFYLFNLSLFSDIGFAHILRIMVIGLRFDLSVIVYFNILMILMHILPLGKVYYNKYYQRTINFLFISINTILISINLSDSVFYHFTQKRSTIDVLKFIFISDDAIKLLPRFLLDYWYLGIFVVAVVFVLNKLSKKIGQRSAHEFKTTFKQFVFKALTMFIILGFCLLGARGGIQLRPLSMMHATTSGPAKQIPIILNTPFTLMTTYGHGGISNYSFFDESELPQYYNVVKQKSNPGNFNNRNVVIIMLESFSKEYVGSLNNYKGYTPFLDSLLANSLAFTNAFSSGYRSMDAIPTALTSIPCLIDDPIITSVYGNNKYTSLANLLKGKSYETAFFHGGTNGTLGLDGFVRFLGFEKYYGRTEYGNDNDYDNYWGIYDEPFLQFMIKKIADMKEPFFAMEFTLSSHYPYSLPKKYGNTFKEGPLRIHKVVRYTDNSLRRFFDEAKGEKWFKNTIFIISADHPAQSVIPGTKGNFDDADNLPDNRLLKYYKNTSGRYAIPILIYQPGDSSLNGIYDDVFQQSDIMPTILDLLNFDGKYIAFGNSAFDTAAAHAAFHYVNGLYQITYKDYCLLFNGVEPTALYLKDDVGHSNNLLEKEPAIALKLENILKAYLQEYSHRMRKNDLQIKTK